MINVIYICTKKSIKLVTTTCFAGFVNIQLIYRDRGSDSLNQTLLSLSFFRFSFITTRDWNTNTYLFDERSNSTSLSLCDLVEIFPITLYIDTSIHLYIGFICSKDQGVYVLGWGISDIAWSMAYLPSRRSLKGDPDGDPRTYGPYEHQKNIKRQWKLRVISS